MTLSDDIEKVDWERLALVIERSPLGKRDPKVLRETFHNSQVRCFAWEGGELIGAGRAITDFVRVAYICDVVVLPEFQGKGIGTEIMSYLADRSKAAHILLYAVPGKEIFYTRLGYRKMKTAMARFTNADAARQMGYIE
jgi:predicted N-acetyltransferase YhbS